MVKAFTAKGLDATQPRSVRFEVRDGRTPGLCLVVQPSGHRSFAFRYRSPVSGKPTKLTLGAYPGEISLEAARAAALDARRAITAGRDPATEKKVARLERDDKGLLVETLLDEYIKKHIKTKNRTSTADEYVRLIEKRIKPAWEGRNIRTITRADVDTLLREMVSKGAPVSANRTFAVIRRFFKWVLALPGDVLPSDKSPAARVVAPTSEASRERKLTEIEMRALWKSTEQAEPFRVMVRLLLVTGQRRGEVSGMQWKELSLDGDEPTWTIPAARAKNDKEHIVPLAPVAVALIQSLPKVDGNQYVLPSSRGKTPISGFSKGKIALDKAMLAELRKVSPNLDEVLDWRLHDLRRTFASGMAPLKQPVHVVERLLNHISGSFGGIVGVYQQYEYAPEMRAAAIAWANYLDDIVNQPAASVAKAA
ncbi:site-specific integrase [Tardiphaga sp.]|uniref:tyrosine-type recombinase/integrase n=1 Tax=Tardiphaga sp. TaxID=1926292 RepID=UPI0026204914|nr:site-specific integrase [Tardiphaga sp.]MDB5616098.1 site-specific integrase [Tardiphaga sp.]